MLNPRICASNILVEVIFEYKSLSASLKFANQSQQVNLTKELCFGVCRYYFQLKLILSKLMTKPIKPQEAQIECLLLLGIYELSHLNTATHAVVSELVECTKILKKTWATKLVNAVLRNFLRNQTELTEVSLKDVTARYNHPQWLIKKIKKDYPVEWENILHANNQQAPMILRVNQQKITTHDYLKMLNTQSIVGHLSEICSTALILEKGCPVTKLPKFADGYCSVQDINAQLAANFLQLSAGQNVLDACAAPGGKTGHILESAPKLASLLAIDNDIERMKIVQENLERLQLSAKTIRANVENLHEWWDKKLFDRILFDAPCSATGVIRRHPDIKLLREESDIANLVKIQRQLLTSLWQTLKPSGLLLYVTCSILPEENSENITWFLQQNNNAKILPLPLTTKHAAIGLQLLPGEFEGDGFYFCLLQKK